MRVGQVTRCGCGKSRHPDNLCDGSHAQLTPEEIAQLNARHEARKAPAQATPTPAADQPSTSTP